MGDRGRGASYQSCRLGKSEEGRQSFYKLNDETVAEVHEDLAKDYRELAEQHSEELAQLMDDFGESQEELLDRLIAIRDVQQHTEPVAELGSAEQVEGHLNTQEATITHESADPTHREQTEPIMRSQTEEMVAAPITQLDEDINTPELTTQEGDDITSPLTLGEGQQPRNDMAEAITPELNQDVRTEASILEILEAE